MNTWILIVVFGANGSFAISQQEYAYQKTCLAAKAETEKMVGKVSGYSRYQAVCVPK